jgi:hypothetical protein
MHYVLTTDRGNEYKFYILACAETYRIMWGGTLRSVEDQYTNPPPQTIKLNHLRLVA